MNLRGIVELAALASAHSPHLIETGGRLPLDPLQAYWSSSRAQQRLWLARLVDFPAEIATASTERQAILWARMTSLLADIYVGDLTARVWGAVLTAADRSGGETCGEPIAKSVALLYESVRHRALQTLLDGTGLDENRGAALNRLRSRLERWSDVLVGHLVRRYGVAHFAVDPERAREFGEEQLRDGWESGHSAVWGLYSICLRASLPEVRLPTGRLADLREAVSRAVLASFPEESFLDSGVMKSVRLHRLLKGAGRADTSPRIHRPANRSWTRA